MKQIAIILIATFALFSCTKENMDGGSPTTQGVQVIFKTSDFAQLNTRAASEIQLKDVTILQFKDGVLIEKELLENVSTSSAVTLEFLKQISAANLDENGKLIEDGKENLIYFIANAKAVTGAEVGLNKGVSFAALKALKFGTNNLSEVLPMTGEYYGGVAEGATTQINVTLIRTVAKVNFTLNTANFMDNGAQPSIVVNSITLHDVPQEITPYPCDNRPALPANGNPGVWVDGMITPFPAYTAEGFDSYDVTKNNSTTPLTNYVAYMPENARGSFPNIASNKDKRPESIDTEHQGGLTYILVDLDYTTASGVSKKAKYKIYIGGDAAGDMNLLRNTQYNITTYIYGANETDTRIDVTPIFDPESGLTTELTIQKPANCYMINPASIPNSFTIPLSQARNGWSYIKASETNNQLLTDFDTLIKSDNWKIVTLWKTWSGTENIIGTKATGISFSEGSGANGEQNYFATLTFPEGLVAGNNAVIALVDKDDNKKIYWSWHLWFTDYNPDAQDPSNMNGQTHSYFGAAFQPGGTYSGKTMMDRNLGATATGVLGAISHPTTTEDAVSYYGLLYQFGRKDPFVSSSSGNNNTLVTIYDAGDNTITDNAAAAEAGSNLAKAVLNPMNFYINASGNWTTPSEDLWNSEGGKSAFDPCPAGWRIPIGGTAPADNPWAGFSDGSANSVGSGNYLGDYFKWKPANVSGSNIVGSAGGLYSYGTDTQTQAWYPASGNRSNTNGNLGSVGASGYYWSTLPYSPTSGCNLSFGNSSVNPSTVLNRAYGFPVRCVKE